MSLLDNDGPVSEALTEPFQMLSTNPEIYTLVLGLKGAKDEATGKVNWA